MDNGELNYLPQKMDKKKGKVLWGFSPALQGLTDSWEIANDALLALSQQMTEKLQPIVEAKHDLIC